MWYVADTQNPALGGVRVIGVNDRFLAGAILPQNAVYWQAKTASPCGAVAVPGREGEV